VSGILRVLQLFPEEIELLRGDVGVAMEQTGKVLPHLVVAFYVSAEESVNVSLRVVGGNRERAGVCVGLINVPRSKQLEQQELKGMW
jgi:hypothetical protein